MKKILFRGKTPAGKWVSSGNLLHFNEEGGLFFIPAMDDKCIADHDLENDDIIAIENTRFHKVLTETVSQYTGFNDKNGNPIFEGDILRIGEGYWDCFVEFESGCFITTGCEKARRCHKSPLLTGNVFEIIGNIWDNPELLEV